MSNYLAHNAMDPGISKFCVSKTTSLSASSPLLSFPQVYTLPVIMTIFTQLENDTPAKMSSKYTTE